MSDAYTPVVADKDNLLIAEVMYTDRTRDEDNDDQDNGATDMFVGFMNTATSDPTTAVRDNPQNQPPSFVDGASTARLVEENTRALTGTADDDLETSTDNPADNVGGGPVMGRDADTEDTLTYSISGADADSFRIRQNGQLEVSTKAKLDYESKNEYTVTVTAKDSSSRANDTASITVTVHVTDLDEKPVIRATGGGLAITGPSAASQAEGVGGEVGRYSVSGAGGETVSWRLSGSDARHFSISQSGVVSFRSAPDYESKSSYTFTVNATVNGESVTRGVTVSVTNVEEPGAVTISPRTLIAVDTVLTATLTDPDGGITNMSWEWVRDSAVIPGANSRTYTVVADDAENFLVARVRYTDAQGSGKRAEETTNEAVAAVGAPQTVLERYDTNEDGRIDRPEASVAILQFSRGQVSRAIASEVFALYSGIV